jgi:hypothetical protein
MKALMVKGSALLQKPYTVEHGGPSVAQQQPKDQQDDHNDDAEGVKGIHGTTRPSYIGVGKGERFSFNLCLRPRVFYLWSC